MFCMCIQEYDAFCQHIDSSKDPRVAAPSAAERPTESTKSSLAKSVLDGHFKPMKKVSVDSHKGRIFKQLLTLLIVFARLPFNILVNPVFKAFVWFLDPSVPIPTRQDITGKWLPEMVNSRVEANVHQLLKGVRGVDLWMA